jgi:hypothetical protein
MSRLDTAAGAKSPQEFCGLFMLHGFFRFGDDVVPLLESISG